MIKRKLFNELKKHLNKKEISFIVGPRQAGKTTLMLLLKEYLEKRRERTLFLNLDIEMDKEHLTSQVDLLKRINLEFGKERGFVFIDEIQRKEDAGIFLKGIYDMDLPYKFIVSGSGSVELKEKIHESLAGRKRVFELSTLNFEEFVDFKTEYKYKDRLLDFFEIEINKGLTLLDEYMNFGGYPRVVLEEKLSEKLMLINEIYRSYIERDISYLLNVSKTDAFSNLVKLIASQIGKMVNYSELSSTLGISFKTIKEYMWYLEKTYIIQRISPYFKNVRKEITKSPVVYFYDIGMRNFAIGDFGNIRNKGFVFQNFVFNILKEKLQNTSSKIFYWRTKDKSEVDFVIDTGREVIPIEVKYQKLKTPKVPGSLRSFIKRYTPKKSFIVNLSLDLGVDINGTTVYFVPFYKMLKQDLF